MFKPSRVNAHWWFVEDTSEHQRVHFKFFYGWGFYGKLTFKSYFAITLFGYLRLNLKKLKMGWEVKNTLKCRSKDGLMESGAKTGKFLTKIVKKLSHLLHIISSLIWLFTTYLGTPWFPSHRGPQQQRPQFHPLDEKKVLFHFLEQASFGIL